MAHLVTSQQQVDATFWQSRRVLVTGHTGFKGAWLALWLQSMGAEVFGISRDVPTAPSLYELAQVSAGMADELRVDIRQADEVVAATRRWAPDTVMHLAAQPLVGRSFADPRETFDVNIMGTVNLLEAVRMTRSVAAAVVITSDKCYENAGWERGYREDDPMGGFDPYSASKGAVEIVVSAYRRSFFFEPGTAAIASARAGNVIGGGDWAADRLIPDIVRAIDSRRPLRVRNPDAVRPWQHVLNPLSGYLLLAQAAGLRAGVRAAAGTLAPPMATPARCRGSSKVFASAGRAGRPGRPTPGRTHTRRHISNSTPPAHACGWAGDRSSRSRPLYTASWTGMRRSPRGPTCDRPRWPSCVRSAARRREGGIAPGRVGRKRTWPRSNSGTVPSTPVSSDRLA